MKYSSIALGALLLLTATQTQETLASEPAVVGQSGSYNYTIVRQRGDDTIVFTRQINENRYARLSERLPLRIERMSGRYLLFAGRGRSRFCARSGQTANSVTIDQTGGGNLASATQIGTNDSATVAQNGTSNLSYTVQLGDNQQAQTSQSGDHNIALITQRCV